MLAMLVAYNAAGAIVATLDHCVALDELGQVVGLIDFAAHEAAGGEHTDIWRVGGAAGSKVWPEWIGGAIHDFRVELEGPPGRKRIAALVHQTSGHRRERVAVEAALEALPVDETGARDARALLGGPGRPLILDEHGRNAPAPAAVARPALPIIGRK